MMLSSPALRASEGNPCWRGGLVGKTDFDGAAGFSHPTCYNNNVQDIVDLSNTGQDDAIMRLEGQDDRLRSDLAAEERLVFYEYCISLIFLCLRRTSAVVRLRPGQRGWIKGLPYTILSLMLGWWCLPWGLIYTPLTLWTNLSGGRRITKEELQRWSDLAKRG